MGIEWAWLLPALCAGGFVAVVLLGRGLPGQGAFIAVLAIAACFGMFWPIMVSVVQDGPGSFARVWFEAGDITLKLGMTVDQLAIVMLGLVTAVALAVQVFSLGYMRADPRFGWYFAVQSLFAASMIGLVLANNLLVFYVTWEVVGLCSYLLIGFWYERRSAAEAAKKAFITTRFGDVALLVGILVLFKAAGTFEMGQIFALATAGELSATTLNLSAVLIFIGAAGKSAQFPFHVWLPDAMEGPTPVSALIHAATMVAAGVYLVARMAPLFVAAPGAMLLVSYIGLTTAFVGATLAMAQNDIKKVLAYSTVSQLGFMMLALGSFGFTAGIFHLVTHGFFKAILFLGAGSIIHSLHEEQDLRRMGGLRLRMPITFATFLIAGTALIGLFPLSGFFSKDEVLLAVLDGRGTVWLTAALIAAGMTALYVTRLMVMAFLGTPRSDAAQHARESPLVMGVPLVALAVPAAGLGLLALPWTSEFRGFGSFLVFPPLKAHGYELNGIVFGASLAVAAGATVWAWRLYGNGRFSVARVQARLPRLYSFVENKFYMDRLYQWFVDRVVLSVARAAGWFDRYVVNNTGVDGTGWVTVMSGRLLRYHETGIVSSYVLAITLSAVIIVLIVIAG